MERKQTERKYTEWYRVTLTLLSVLYDKFVYGIFSEKCSFDRDKNYIMLKEL